MSRTTWIKLFFILIPSLQWQASASQSSVFIQESDLSKEFFFSGLQSSGTEPRPITFLETRLVHFRLVNGKLEMLQSPTGLYSNPEAAPDLLLAEFPVEKTANGKVYFDFTRGLKRLFTSSPWPDPNKRVEKDFAFLEVLNSRTAWARRSGNELIIQQKFMARHPESKGNLIPTSVTFSLVPRNVKTEIASLAAELTDFPRYFVSPWTYQEDGSLRQNALRWPNGPIEVYVSSAVPRKIKDAVERGLLYWNKAFGDDRVRVIQAAPGTTATDLKHKIFVEWSEDPSGEKAYANWTANPLTGELLKAVIYLPSSFIGMMEGHTGVVAENYSSLQVCDGEYSHGTNFDRSPIHRFRKMRLENDYSFLLAHELGHALGLRHNFAGRLQATFNPTQAQNYLSRFMQDFELMPGHLPTGTVMAGGSAEEKTILGEMFKKVDSPLPYDKAAIDALYKGKRYDRKSMPIHCTDENRAIVGCGAGVGNPPLVGAAIYFQKEFKGLPGQFVHHYISALTPRVGPTPPIHEVTITDEEFEKLFEQLFKARAVIISIFDENTQDIRVRKDYPHIDSEQKDLLQLQQQRLWTKEVNDFGGLKKFLLIPSATRFHAMLPEIERLLRGPLRSGVGSNSEPYRLSDLQIEFIKRNAHAFIQKAKHYVINKDLKLLALKNSVAGHPLEDQLVHYYAIRLLHYITESSPQKVHGVARTYRSVLRALNRKESAVAIPTAVHSPEAKAKMIALLRQPQLTQALSFRYRSQVKLQIRDWMTEILGGISPEEVDLQRSSPVVKAWITEHLDLIKKI